MTQEQHHRPTIFEIEHQVQTQEIYQHARCKTIIHIQELAKADLAATEAVVDFVIIEPVAGRSWKAVELFGSLRLCDISLPTD